MFPQIPRPAFLRPAAAAPAAQNQQQAPAPAAEPEHERAQAAENSAATAPAPAAAPQRTGFLLEMENLFLPLIYSLIPTWQPQAAPVMPVPGAHPHQE